MNIQEPVKTADEQLCRMREQATKLLDCLCTELGTGITQAMAELRATIATSEPCKHAEDSERLDWDVAKAALRPPSSCTHEEQTSRLVAAIEPFRKYIELRYAIFSEHALDSIPTLQVSHAGRFGVSAAEITKADWDRIRYVLVPDIGVCEEAGDK